MKSILRPLASRVQSIIYRHGLPIVLFTAVYIAVSWPLPLHFNDSLLGGISGDGWLEVEQFWWYKHSLLDLKASPFFDPKFFFPSGWNTLTGSHSPSLVLPTVPFTALLGPIFAYNLVMALGFLFASAGTYALVYKLSLDQLAGTLAAVVYAFCMTRLFRIGGHINVQLGSAWIPWILFCIEMGRVAHTRKGQQRWFMLAGMSYAGSVLCYFYYVYLAALPLAAYLIWYVWQERLNHGQLRQALLNVTNFVGTSAFLIAPFAIPVMLARSKLNVAPYPLEATVAFGISPDRLLLPNRYHPWWGQWFATRFPDVGEQTIIFLGLTAVTLALASVFLPVHKRRNGYLAVAAVSFVLGLGPELHWNTQPLGIPLPGLLLFNYLPFYNVLRVWARFAIVLNFCVAVLAGLTIAYIRPKWQLGTAIASFLLCAVILESFGQPFRMVHSQELIREVDIWLAEQQDVAFLELPLNYRINGSLHYSRIIHNQANVSGYAVAMPATFRDNVSNFSSFPNQATVDVLAEWNVDYLLYTTTNRDEFTAVTLPQITSLSGISLLNTYTGYVNEHVFVFSITPR